MNCNGCEMILAREISCLCAEIICSLDLFTACSCAQYVMPQSFDTLLHLRPLLCTIFVPNAHELCDLSSPSSSPSYLHVDVLRNDDSVNN